MEPYNTNNPYDKRAEQNQNTEGQPTPEPRMQPTPENQAGMPELRNQPMPENQAGMPGLRRQPTLKSQPTLPLEGAPSRNIPQEDKPYTPQPPRPRGFQPRPTVTFPIDDNPQQTQPRQFSPQSTIHPPVHPHSQEQQDARPQYQVNTQAPQHGGYQPAQQQYQPAQQQYQRQTGGYQPQNAPRQYPTPHGAPNSTVPNYPRQGAQPNGTRPIQGNGGFPAGADAANGFARNNNYNNNNNYGQPERKKSKMPMIIAAAVVVLLLIGGGVWYFLDNANNDPAPSQAEDFTALVDAPDAPEAAAPASAEEVPAPVVSEGTEGTTLFNRPLTYSGHIAGEAATLNIVLFQNGRIEGNLSYKSGRTAPLYGSYSWTDNGHKMDVRLTVDTGHGGSESWIGFSSVIKDNLSHSLTFPNIATSDGESKRAVFNLQ